MEAAATLFRIRYKKLLRFREAGEMTYSAGREKDEDEKEEASDRD